MDAWYQKQLSQKDRRNKLSEKYPSVRMYVHSAIVCPQGILQWPGRLRTNKKAALLCRYTTGRPDISFFFCLAFGVLKQFLARKEGLQLVAVLGQVGLAAFLAVKDAAHGHNLESGELDALAGL